MRHLSNNERGASWEEGFTIIELMIATVVVTFILLLVTVMITSIGDLYTKGINTARIQDDVRTIANDLASQLQLSSNFNSMTESIPEGDSGNSVVEGAVCIDSTRYSYVVGVRIGHALEVGGVEEGNTFQHVLWRDSYSGACVPATLTNAQPSPNGIEMISPNSSLIDFSVTPNNNIYTVVVNAAYGDPDLLTTSSGNTVCSGQLNTDQFCATANLTTAVMTRVTSTDN